MKNFRFYFSLILLLLLSLNFSNATIYNKAGDFSVDITSLNNKIFNTNITSNFNFVIINNLNTVQNIKLISSNISGWDINLNSNNLILLPNSKKIINLNLIANNNFDYAKNIISSNVIKIAKKEEYTGSFVFPIKIVGENENMDLKFSVKIDKKPINPISFKTMISTEKLSPKNQLKYSIQSYNILKDSKVFIRVEMGNVIISEFSDIFTKTNNLKFYQEKISSNFNPGNYLVKITIRIPQKDGKSIIEWSENTQLRISEFKNIITNSNYKKSLFKDSYSIEIFNNGNLNSNYSREFNVSTLKSFLLSSNQNYISTSNGIKFNIDLNKGEKKTINYSINYLPIYVFLIILLIILTYIFIRKNSNPLDVENKIYEIKNIVNEGVKSLKIRIGFENIKQNEIEELKVIFRMPSYLTIKDNSFSLTEPNHVLKGKKQYKLIWNFKRFEKDDSRILGFALINSRGILGDIKLPDLEFEVKINGKIRRYYKSFPTIRG